MAKTEESKLNDALTYMTPIQARRCKLFFKYNSVARVARIEGVCYQTIQVSIRQGRLRAKKKGKIFENFCL